MKIMMKNKILNLSFLTAVLCLFVLVTNTDAQTSRRKKTTKPQPVVSPTPPPQQEDVPVVISRADDYQNENQTVLTGNQQIPAPVETETEGEKIDKFSQRIKELTTRIKTLESTGKNEYDEKQKRLLLNLDILSKTEQRAESLRKQLFEMIEKESTVRTRLEQLQFDLRPELIERSSAMTGSLRPEEIRDHRKKSLEAEKNNLESLLTQIQTNRAKLEESVQKADFLVEKVRLKLDKEIDDALASEDENQ